MSLRFILHGRYLKFRVVVHPAHGSRCEGGFLWAIRCIQSLQNQFYSLEMTLLPVPDRKIVIFNSVQTKAGHSRLSSEDPICELTEWNTLNKIKSDKLIKTWGACSSPVSVCCGPAVTKEAPCRLGAIFVFVVVLSSQKAACIGEYKLTLSKSRSVGMFKKKRKGKWRIRKHSNRH